VSVAAAGKVYRVGLIFTTLPVFEVDATPGGRALLEGLRQLGYEEGRNLVLERRSAEGKRERYLEIAAELTDVIVTIGTFMTPPSRATTLARLMKMLPVHVPCGDRAKTVESTARIQAWLCGRSARIAKLVPQMGSARSPGARVCVYPDDAGGCRSLGAPNTLDQPRPKAVGCMPWFDRPSFTHYRLVPSTDLALTA
jgi:hypothetical protein